MVMCFAVGCSPGSLDGIFTFSLSHRKVLSKIQYRKIRLLKNKKTLNHIFWKYSIAIVVTIHTDHRAILLASL